MENFENMINYLKDNKQKIIKMLDDKKNVLLRNTKEGYKVYIESINKL
jgi:hypothetical protein